jgi:hypothetical protein
MLSAVTAYVIHERERKGITTADFGTRSELSGEAFGEFVMLLDRQLMTTVVGYGAWHELDDSKVLTEVYQLVEERERRRGS